jgi:hypothetical protein
MASRVIQHSTPLGGWLGRVSKGLAPHTTLPPKPFRLIESTHKKAIVIPWLSTGEKWEELKYTLRSIHTNWTDRDCPIYIIGDAPPAFFKPGDRLRFIHINEYEKSNKDGLWEAWQQGMQIADEVAWWNDDIYLLRETGWDDLKIALTEGEITDKSDTLRASSNSWQRAMGESVHDLLKSGNQRIWRFATHTPYLFERERSLEIFRKYHLHFKGSWVNLYHNHHGTPHTECTPFKATSLPAKGGERYYNHKDPGPDDKSRSILVSMFPNPAPWEKDS